MCEAAFQIEPDLRERRRGRGLIRTGAPGPAISLLSGREEGSAGGYSRGASSAAGAPDDYAQQAEISDDDIPL
jgi:hypothetical protein